MRHHTLNTEFNNQPPYEAESNKPMTKYTHGKVYTFATEEELFTFCAKISKKGLSYSTTVGDDYKVTIL